MPSKKLNVQPISSWFYNCGLGTLVPHLLQHLSPKIASLAQFKEKRSNKKLKSSQGYKLFKQSFLELYVLDVSKRQQIIANNEFNSTLHTLFETYTKATEQTIILGPVLRLTLQKVLLQDTVFKESLWPSFALLVNNCLAYAENTPENKIEGYKCEDTEELLFNSNKNKIQEIVFTLLNGPPPPLEDELPEQEVEITKEMFEQDACPALFLKEWGQITGLACAYIGSAEQPVYLSIEHLAILYRSFGFHLFHTNNVDVPMIAAASKPAFYLKDTFIINKSKAHWELVCQNPESVWEANVLKGPDHLYGTYTAFTAAAGDQKKYSKIIEDLQKNIQSFILDGKNVFMSECPEKIGKSWYLANPFHALAYKIDEILLIESNKSARTVLILSPGFTNFLSNFKDYYDIEDDVDIDELITLLKQYPNPHERSLILSKAFSVYEEVNIGQIYNSFGFDIKLSKNHIKVACRLTNHSETVFKVVAPLKAIEEIFLNFDGENWTCLEEKTLYSEFRNASLKNFPSFIINNEEEFQKSVKNTHEEVRSPMTKSMFFKSLETQELVLVGPKPQVNPKLYFIKDEQGNTALHKMAGLAQEIPFVAIVTELIVSALLDMHEEQFNSRVDTQRGSYNFWSTNKAKETAVSIALRTMNLNWVQKFYAALIVGEEHASDPWVKDKFREDLTKLRNHIGLAINNIITSDALFKSLDSDIEIQNTLEKYFQLDLILGNPFSFDDSENDQFDFLKNCFSFANGDKNPFHLAFKHNRYDKVLNMFQRTIRRTYKEKVRVFAIDYVEAKIESYIFAIVNEYGRTVESCKTLNKKNIASKLALKSWDQLNWQLDYSNKMKNTTTYKGVACGKSVLEVSKNLGGKGSVNAGMTLAWHAAMPVAKTLAPKFTSKISNGISQGISDRATRVGGVIGKTVGAGLDKGASYIPPKPVGEDESYYPKKYKQHLKDMTDISLSTLKKEIKDPKKNKLATLGKYSLKNAANIFMGPGLISSFCPPSPTASSTSELVATGLGIAIEKFSAPTISDPSYYTKNGEYYGKKMGASAPGTVVTALPWVLAPQVTAASLVLGLAGANVARYCLPDYPLVQEICYTLMSDIPLYKDYVSASAEDVNLYSPSR